MNNILVSRPAIFSEFPELVAGISLRELTTPAYIDQNFSLRAFPSDEMSNQQTPQVQRLRQDLTEQLLPGASLCIPQQIHGSTVLVAKVNEVVIADGLITDHPQLLLGVLLADCAGILIYDPIARIIGIAHSGWRGTHANIAHSLVEAMLNAGAQPQNCYAYLTPTACPQHYEVGAEFHDLFASRYIHIGQEKNYFNNQLALRDQLEAEGIPLIEADPRCTIEDHAFHSHRRDGQDAGRSLAFIGLRHTTQIL